jgi:hypothetical protein
MQYLANPRKVYGKIKIIYSDGEISSGLDFTESGNSGISNPEQVIKGYISPSIKTCTMDGYAKMGQGFQMDSQKYITGWRSDVMSKADGTFSINPWIKISFIERPIIKWNVVGDNKLNQYPVEFNLYAYQNETVISAKEIRNNTESFYTEYFNPALEDITAIKLEIIRWNIPNAKVKILQCFDIVEEEYEGSDLKEFEVVEELSTDSNGIVYGLSSDSLSVSVYNKDRKFDKGYLKSLLLLGRKITPYIGIEENGVINYTSLGTFYSEDWNVPADDLWVKIKCSDKLLNLQKISYLGYPYTVNASLYDIAEDILKKSGFTEDKYRIDNSLKEDIVYGAFIRSCSAWEALQEICYGGFCYAFAGRGDIFYVTKEKIIETDTVIPASSILSFEKNTKNTDFCNYVEVKYSEVYKNTEEVTAYENTVIIDANSEIKLTVDYAQEIADAFITFMPSAGIEQTEFESGINSGSFTLKNNNSTIASVTVTITGYTLTINTQTLIIKDDESISRWGKREYSYASTDLIQSYEKAKAIGNALLLKLGMKNSNIKITWRGDPNLKLQDSFTATDRYGDAVKAVCEYNSYKFDEGLKQQTKGRIL